ncbi:MAG: hypothetical protein M1299_01585 [Firmicutes bacterium]|nr:hypothetical protein [Bacillota bacterium]MCL5038517.1 hypothetical protein [Bacillota bacterium]
MSLSDTINIYAQIADLKEIDYRNTLTIVALLELLEEKGFISRNQLAERMGVLDQLPALAVDPVSATGANPHSELKNASP